MSVSLDTGNICFTIGHSHRYGNEMNAGAVDFEALPNWLDGPICDELTPAQARLLGHALLLAADQAEALEKGADSA